MRRMRCPTSRLRVTQGVLCDGRGLRLPGSRSGEGPRKLPQQETARNAGVAALVSILHDGPSVSPAGRFSVVGWSWAG